MKWAALAVVGCAVLSAAARPVAAEPCLRVAIVDGDPVLVSSLSAQLIRRGIAVDEAATSEDSCPAVRATVAQDGGAVSVTVTEPDGARVARDVTTTEIAAIWIESRLRRDVGAPLLAVRVPAVAPGPAPGATVTPFADAVAAAPVVATGRDRVSVGVRIENGSANDGTSWRSYSASVCVKAGPLCVGLLGRLGDNDEAVLDEWFTVATRDSKELLVVASVPVRAGQLRVAPEVGAGIGSVRTRQHGELWDGMFPEPCDPVFGDPVCSPLNVTTTGGRLFAGLTLVIPLHERLALDLGVSATWLQGAHVEPHEHTVMVPDELPPDGCTEPTGCETFYEETVLYPGEPSRLLRAGIGLRVGLP